MDSIYSTVKELEERGYVERKRLRNDKGQMTTVEYVIREQPKRPLPEQEKPEQENPAQSNPFEPQAADGMEMDMRQLYREMIFENMGMTCPPRYVLVMLNVQNQSQKKNDK